MATASSRPRRRRSGRGERANREGRQRRTRAKPCEGAASSVQGGASIDEHSAPGNRTSRHDVHALGRDRPDRGSVPRPPSGRPDAGCVVPEHHGARRLHRRRAARDGRARHAAHRAGHGRGRRPRAPRVDVLGRQQPRHAEPRLGHRPQRGRRRRAQPYRPGARPAARGRRPADGLQVRLDLACRS